MNKKILFVKFEEVLFHTRKKKKHFSTNRKKVMALLHMSSHQNSFIMETLPNV